MRGLVPAVLAIWMLAGLYLGSAGWARAELEETISVEVRSDVEDGAIQCGIVITKNMEECLAFERSRMTESLFPWVSSLPVFFGFLIMALGFGAVGGVIAVLRRAASGEQSLENLYITLPMFGSLVGVLVLGMSYLLPAALVSAGGNLRPTSLLFLTLLGGVFSGQVIDWIESWMTDLFPSRVARDGGGSANE